MLRNVLSAIMGAIALLTFTLPAQAGFVCKPYPEYSIMGMPKVVLVLPNNPVTEGFEILDIIQGEKVNPLKTKIEAIMGPAPWPIDEFMIYQKKDKTKKVLVFLYKECVFGMSLMTPELEDSVFGDPT